MPVEIQQFPCLSDNYGYLLHDSESGLTASIDTPDGEEIARQAGIRGWTLSHIFNTHHHYDHIGGNQYLKDKYGVTIIGPMADKQRIPGIDRAVSDGEVFEFAGHGVQVLHTPGHTRGHCAYYIRSAKSVFVGDTMFVLGCGRLFEGTPEQMYDSLAKLTSLPDDTRVFCAHEYTLSNGAFALTVEPENQNLIDYMGKAQDLRAQDIPTVPTTIGREKLCNPFVRAKTPEELGEMRTAKDQF